MFLQEPVATNPRPLSPLQFPQLLSLRKRKQYVNVESRTQNGQEIAVKRLLKDSGEGELEFKDEVLLLAKL
ncbi:hypothetical protein RJ639_045049 [Escallonia herrerae]|uniref:Uncharacterized protein n=1 Tax=Escallonia herrerae TaxID=1293975 RepID=A0AA88WD34_9ASTE|nr:hypothetical protein RJ639_045049 [Escallonia herrerae]